MSQENKTGTHGTFEKNACFFVFDEMIRPWNLEQGWVIRMSFGLASPLIWPHLEAKPIHSLNARKAVSGKLLRNPTKKQDEALENVGVCKAIFEPTEGAFFMGVGQPLRRWNQKLFFKSEWALLFQNLKRGFCNDNGQYESLPKSKSS